MTLQGNPAVCTSVMYLRWPYYTSLEFHILQRTQTSETLIWCIYVVLSRKNYFLGRFVPYFERAWLRSFTPAQSKEPRTVW